MSQSLGDRMKQYEKANSTSLTRRVPVIIRVDGRAFHTFTRGLQKPFDTGLIRSMVNAAHGLADHIDGCVLAYVQSDEASFLLTDFARVETEAWFAYDLQKVVSLASSGMTARFLQQWSEPNRTPPLVEFDARAFSLPREEVANYFLWRAKDWHRNSVQMYAQAYFSPKQLHGKKLTDIHEMLHGIGRNWATDTQPYERNGMFIMAKSGERHDDVLPNFSSVSKIVDDSLLFEYND